MKFELHKQERSIIVGLLVCALIAVIGYSFAYFISGTSVTGNGAKTNATTANLPTVEYQAGNSGLSLLNAYPGKSATKKFTVTYAGTKSDNAGEEISIRMKIIENEFMKCSAVVEPSKKNGCDETDTDPQLMVTITKGDGVSVGSLDLTGTVKGTTEESIEIAKDKLTATTDYTVTIEFKETNKNQGHNAGKNFDGSIEVQFADTEGE